MIPGWEWAAHVLTLDTSWLPPELISPLPSPLTSLDSRRNNESRLYFINQENAGTGSGVWSACRSGGPLERLDITPFRLDLVPPEELLINSPSGRACLCIVRDEGNGSSVICHWFAALPLGVFIYLFLDLFGSLHQTTEWVWQSEQNDIYNDVIILSLRKRLFMHVEMGTNAKIY